MTDRHSTHIEIESTSTFGQSYNVYFDGEMILSDVLQPEFDAARALLERGLRGKASVSRRGKNQIDSIINIEKAARLCVISDADGRLRLSDYLKKMDGLEKLKNLSVDKSLHCD